MEEEAPRSDEPSVLRDMVSSWFGMYIVAPATLAVAAVACMIVFALGLPFAVVVVAALGIPLLLFVLPFRNQLQQLGIALALAGGGWFVLLALWGEWSGGAIALGVLALAIGLVLFSAGRRVAPETRRRGTAARG